VVLVEEEESSTGGDGEGSEGGGICGSWADMNGTHDGLD
jgi:hypothetical protein